MDKAALEAIQKSLNEQNARLDQIEKSRKETENENIASIFKGGLPLTRESDEQRALKLFGCANVKELIQINTMDPAHRAVPLEVKASVINLKMAVNTSRFIQQIFNREAKDVIGATAEQDRVASVKGLLDGNYYGKTVLAPRLKAFSSTGAGVGDEYVPTLLASMFIEELQLERAVAGLFQDIKMQSQPYEIPVASGFTKARQIAENTQATDTTFTTSKLTFTSKKMVEYFILPEELNEDAAPDIFALSTRQLSEAHRRGEEAAIINGDDDGTHIDSDTQAAAADVAEKLWKGLRRQALANSANGATTDFGNAVLSSTLLRTMRQRIGKYGVNPMDLAWICDPIAYQQFQTLQEVNTIDKFGPRATVIQGQLDSYMGIPVIVSEFMRSDLNATGVYDGVTTNRTAVLLVNKRRWWNGIRRPLQLKVMQDLAYHDRWLMAAYQRRDFKGLTQGAIEKAVSYGYNVAT